MITKLIHLLHKPGVIIALINMGVVFTPEQLIEMGFKIVLGLPAAIYMCFKIYNEFLKK